MENIFYFAQVFDTLHCIGTIVFVLSVMATIISGISLCVCDYDADKAKAAKVLKAAIAPLIIGLLLTTSVPSKQTYLFMVGGRVVDSAVDSNPEIKELPANTLNLLNEYIKQKTDDLYQEKEKKSQKK